MSRSHKLNALKRAAESSAHPGRRQVYQALVGYLEGFEALLDETQDAERVFNMLVQLEVELYDDPENCLRELYPDRQAFSPFMQRAYNVAAYELLREYGMLQTMRKVCTADITPLTEAEALGNFVTKSYGERLLANFLTNTPSREWVGQV